MRPEELASELKLRVSGPDGSGVDEFGRRCRITLPDSISLDKFGRRFVNPFSVRCSHLLRCSSPPRSGKTNRIVAFGVRWVERADPDVYATQQLGSGLSVCNVDPSFSMWLIFAIRTLHFPFCERQSGWSKAGVDDDLTTVGQLLSDSRREDHVPTIEGSPEKRANERIEPGLPRVGDSHPPRMTVQGYPQQGHLILSFGQWTLREA
jgi:hypothetical protein